MIVGARIDFRLIHGQVANLWASARQVGRIMVIDEEAAQNDIQKKVLRMACPATCRLSVLPTERAAENILAGKYDAQRLFIVAKKPETYLKLVQAGVAFDEIIVGNMTAKDVVKKINSTVSCDQGDLDAFAALKAAGVPMVYQLSPLNPAEDFTF